MQKIITILGPTAIGKSKLAIELAQEFNGAIISTDSRQVYKDFDIGSGKVSHSESNGVKHYMLDTKEIWENYSVAEFQKDTKKILEELEVKRVLPFLVGGTGLYIESILYNYNFISINPDYNLRANLALLSRDELQQKLLKLNQDHALNKSDWNNPVRLIRAIEIAISANKTPTSPSLNQAQYDSLVIGLKSSLQDIKNKITNRVDYRLDHGAVIEIQKIRDILSTKLSPIEVNKNLKQLGLGSIIINDYIDNKIDYDTMREKYIQAEYQYARRQLTWFRKMNNVIWFNPNNDNINIAVRQLITDFLK